MIKVMSPLSIRELADCLPLLESGAVFAGGCTDLSVRFLKEQKPGQILNVTLIDELKGISAYGGFLRIGSAVTLTELSEYPLPECFSALKQAARGIGSAQIRNAATIGGNVMNASPAGDLLPCLFLLSAIAEFMKPDGSINERPINGVVIGAKKTSLSYNEVLTTIKIPVPPAGARSAFYKLGYRKTVSLARINIAMSKAANGEIRFYLGAVAPVPVRVPEAEKILAENEWDERACDKLTAYLSDMLKRTVPDEFDRDYKTFAVKGAVYDIIEMFR